jgi:hypothetical protein
MATETKTFTRQQTTIVDVEGEYFYVSEVFDSEWKTWDASVAIEEQGEETAEIARCKLAWACRRFADAVLGKETP